MSLVRSRDKRRGPSGRDGIELLTLLKEEDPAT